VKIKKWTLLCFVWTGNFREGLGFFSFLKKLKKNSQKGRGFDPKNSPLNTPLTLLGKLMEIFTANEKAGTASLINPVKYSALAIFQYPKKFSFTMKRKEIVNVEVLKFIF